MSETDRIAAIKQDWTSRGYTRVFCVPRRHPKAPTIEEYRSKKR